MNGYFWYENKFFRIAGKVVDSFCADIFGKTFGGIQVKF